jgi:hypothetical protein
MRFFPRALLAGGLGFAAAVLVACGGGSGLLSSDQASNLNDQLDQVAAAVGAGRCADAINAAAGFDATIRGLPGSINARLASNLRQGSTAIRRLAAQDCQPKAETTPTTPTQTTTTPTTTPTSTTTTPTNPVTNPATGPQTTTTPATTGTGTGTTSTGTGNGGAGLGNTSTGGSGGAGTGIQNGQ